MAELDEAGEEIRRIAAEAGGAAQAAQAVDDLARARRGISGRAHSPGREVEVEVDAEGRVTHVRYFDAVGSLAPDRLARLTLETATRAREDAARATEQLVHGVLGDTGARQVREQLGLPGASRTEER